MAGRIAYYGNIVRDGLILDLDAAKRDSYPGSGAPWRDIAGGVITGSLVNGPTFNSDNGGSIVFDGVDDYVQLLNSPTYKIQFPLTINAWFNVQTLANYGIIIRNDNTSDAHWGVNIAIGNSYEISVGYGNGIENGPNGRRTYGTSASIININTWYNFTCVLPTNLICNGYLNGSPISIPYLSGTATTLVYGSGGGTLGYRTDVPGVSYYKGNISQIQIYNRTLSAAEVTQNYNALKGRYGL